MSLVVVNETQMAGTCVKGHFVVDVKSTVVVVFKAYIAPLGVAYILLQQQLVTITG